MNLKSKIFSLAVLAGIIFSVVACNENNVSPDVPQSQETSFETYIYQGVSYKEPVKENGDGRFENEILNQVWFGDGEPAMLFKNNTFYLYDSDAEMMEANYGGASKKEVNASRVVAPFASIDLFKEHRYVDRISGYAGAAQSQKFNFYAIKGLNDEVSSVKLSNGSREGRLVVKLYKHAFGDKRFPGKVLTLQAEPGEFVGRPDVGKQRFNDITSSWEFFYQ